jgi:hypothetical protein
VLVHLDCAEEELTAPELPGSEEPEAAEVDPLDAKVGEALGDGAVVRRRLGRGSTAVALLVDRGEDADPREVVYKVALGGAGNATPLARILTRCATGVVQAFGETELAGRRVLVEALAGVTSLADELRGRHGHQYCSGGAPTCSTPSCLEQEGRAPRHQATTWASPSRPKRNSTWSCSTSPGSRKRQHQAGTPPTWIRSSPTSHRQWDLDASGAAAVTLRDGHR